MSAGKNIYIASDLHLGAPNHQQSLVREKLFVKWLDSVEPDIAQLYLLGDIFDFWFEYKHAVPKGYVRLLGKLAQLADNGVAIHIFTGNHDLWYRDYLTEQFGAVIHHQPLVQEFFGKRYYLAHGDGLGPGDHGYKLMKKVFTNPVCKWLFARLHPNFGIGLAQYFSSLSRNHTYDPGGGPEVLHRGKDEYLYQHSLKVLAKEGPIDYFIYGHRHLMVDEALRPEVRVIILGDWIQYFSYLTITPDRTELSLFPVTKPLPLSS